ncbi:MAG TPA: class I SAM-dependent methyltransferase [Gaiellaceae bacterium]|nr:class I SAM-dependent methyltransferase [Gaiellaceae bacterium]
MKLDNPLLVRWEYASEERLTKRNEIFRALIRGTNPEDVAIEALAEVGPKRVLDVGCGTGTLAKRIVEEVGAEVCAVDTSERMVELARALGVDARVADAEQLPYDDRSFDAVFAGWVLYHVPGLPKAIAECARVVTEAGRLVASTYREDNISELWELIEPGIEPRDPLSFSHANGEELLGASFRRVERRDVEAKLVFEDADSMRTFVASTIDRAYLAPKVPELSEPFEATTRHVVFVAEEPR